ncbi:MAG: hypothetical protein VR65_20010 [Desulfobulbaceae bacterium BRH_c16a]|nr:MAG: hypothetical protein VR65_20010 [Desulfobulbaceae bacterium BRH_c16a]
MQILLPAIKNVLQTLPQLPRRSDCYITPHVNYMPTGTRQPCLGIKDGGVTREEQPGEMVELTMRIELAAFVRMTTDGGEAVVGLYRFMDDASDLLMHNHLGLTDIDQVQIGPDRPTEMFQAENKQWIVKLVRTMSYTLERSNI